MICPLSMSPVASPSLLCCVLCSNHCLYIFLVCLLLLKCICEVVPSSQCAQGSLPLETPHSFSKVSPNPVGLWHHLWSSHWTSVMAPRAPCASVSGQPSLPPDTNLLEDNTFCSSWYLQNHDLHLAHRWHWINEWVKQSKCFNSWHW